MKRSVLCVIICGLLMPAVVRAAKPVFQTNPLPAETKQYILQTYKTVKNKKDQYICDHKDQKKKFKKTFHIINSLSSGSCAFSDLFHGTGELLEYKIKIPVNRKTCKCRGRRCLVHISSIMLLRM